MDIGKESLFELLFYTRSSAVESSNEIKPLYISRYSGDVYNVQIRNREHITGCRVFSTTAAEELIDYNVYDMVI